MASETFPPYLVRESDGHKFVRRTDANGTYYVPAFLASGRHSFTSYSKEFLLSCGFLTPEEADLLPTRKECPAFSVTIFMAGDLATAKSVCQAECDREGLCVTIEPTTYIYTNGSEEGFRVGLINYARFPTTKEKLLDRARKLARLLLERCNQTSFSIVTPETSYYYSRRRFLQTITGDPEGS